MDSANHGGHFLDRVAMSTAAVGVAATIRPRLVATAAPQGAKDAAPIFRQVVEAQTAIVFATGFEAQPATVEVDFREDLEEACEHAVEVTAGGLQAGGIGASDKADP